MISLLLMSGFLRGAIRLYQLTLAYFFVGACRFEPSCSAYAAEAVMRHGALKGSWLAAHRLCRCGPWARPRLRPGAVAVTLADRFPAIPPSAPEAQQSSPKWTRRISSSLSCSRC